MKLLVISDYRSFHTARPEAEMFISLASLGMEITIMTYGTAQYNMAFKEAGIKLIDFHPENKKDPKEIAFIRKTIIDHNIQIVHLFNSVSSINGIAAAKGLSVKICLYRGYCGNIHRLDPLSYRKYLHPRVDMIMCNSIGVQDLLRKHLIRNKEKAITINKGHRLSWYADIISHDIRKELGISSTSLLCVNVANNRRMKGIPYLLEAMAKLGKKDVHLLLVGRDMDIETNLAFVRKNNIGQNIHFLGFRKDVLSIVKSCDVFVSSSIKGESITKSVIEAMSLGVAAIITDIPGNVELVNHKESGLVVPSKNGKALAKAIEQLVDNRNLLDQLKTAAPKHIEQHLNADTSVQKLHKAYTNLIKE